jgi:hypothetical protein
MSQRIDQAIEAYRQAVRAAEADVRHEAQAPEPESIATDNQSDKQES